MKALLSVFILSSLLLTGCTKIVEVPVYIKASCPTIEVLSKVAPINIQEINGTITEESVDNLLVGARQLRKSETYYFEQVSKYNSEFTKINVDK